jgi:hypothetical protein
MYSTPELLLVGAAQHLVLGDSPRAVGWIACGADTELPIEADDTYLDNSEW